MEPRKENDIELKSEPMNEMLSHPPSWIVRSGNGLFLVILFILLGLSWFIRYPDEIGGDVIISTSEPPIVYSNQLYVQLKKLSVADGERVKKNQLLAEFDNQALPNDISRAEKYLEELESMEFGDRQKLPAVPSSLMLGSFGELWKGLENKVVTWNNQIVSGIDQQQCASVEREIQYRERLQVIANRKIELSESEYNLIAEELKTSHQLADQSAISKQSLNQDKRSENQAMQSIQSQKEQFVQNLIQLNVLRKELVQLKYDQQVKVKQLRSELQVAVASLLSRIVEWRKNAVWLAPCDGKVVFNKHLQIHQFYNPNQASIVVVPTGNNYTAIATIETAGSGKVAKGQKVFIELTDYPKLEFGMLEGRVSSITQIDKEGKYEVRISLPEQLKTTYNKKIPARALLKGKAKIITTNKRLLNRFFDKLTEMIK